MVMNASFLKKLNSWAAKAAANFAAVAARLEAAPFQNRAPFPNRAALVSSGAFQNGARVELPEGLCKPNAFKSIDRQCSKRFLYRRLGSGVIVILAFLVLGATGSVAQGGPQLKRPVDIPQEKPPEVKKPKKVKGPRAVGLLQINSKGKGTLIPIAILVDGKFYDASVYKADPVPMALDSGTIYEVEQTGDSQGLFTVSGALHRRSGGSANPWVGAGSYLPNGSEEAKKTRTAEDVPKGMDNSDSDAPPRLTRGGASKADGSKPSSGPSSSTANSGASTGGDSSAKPGAATGSSGTASGSGSARQEKPAPAASDKPANGGTEPAPATPQGAAGQTSQTQASPNQPSQSQTAQSRSAESYYRPTLRRGKPTQSAPEDDDEAAATTGKPAGTGAIAGPVRLMPAISDSGGPDPRAYKFFWKAGEEDEQREHMLALATQEVRAYANALAKNRIPANPPDAKAGPAKKKAPAKPALPVLENVQFHAFDLWLNNQPVTILSAEAQLPPEPGATAPAEAYTYSVTVAARTDIYGNLRKLYSGVTDKFHLDVTPRLELIDAVDADGDGRGELLFRETTDAGSGYIIYRATADKLWKMFDSLGE
jgi:hypothetical protein